MPLPACFDPDIPLNFEELGQGVSLAQEMNTLGSHGDEQDTTVDEEPETVSIHQIFTSRACDLLLYWMVHLVTWCCVV